MTPHSPTRPRWRRVLAAALLLPFVCTVSPTPAYALRGTNAGQEESVKAGLEDALQVAQAVPALPIVPPPVAVPLQATAGLEERKASEEEQQQIVEATQELLRFQAELPPVLAQRLNDVVNGKIEIRIQQGGAARNFDLTLQFDSDRNMLILWSVTESVRKSFFQRAGVALAYSLGKALQTPGLKGRYRNDEPIDHLRSLEDVVSALTTAREKIEEGLGQLLGLLEKTARPFSKQLEFGQQTSIQVGPYLLYFTYADKHLYGHIVKTHDQLSDADRVTLERHYFWIERVSLETGATLETSRLMQMRDRKDVPGTMELDFDLEKEFRRRVTSSEGTTLVIRVAAAGLEEPTPPAGAEEEVPGPIETFALGILLELREVLQKAGWSFTVEHTDNRHGIERFRASREDEEILLIIAPVRAPQDTLEAYPNHGWVAATITRLGARNEEAWQAIKQEMGTILAEIPTAKRLSGYVKSPSVTHDGDEQEPLQYLYPIGPPAAGLGEATWYKSAQVFWKVISQTAEPLLSADQIAELGGIGGFDAEIGQVLDLLNVSVQSAEVSILLDPALDKALRQQLAQQISSWRIVADDGAIVRFHVFLYGEKIEVPSTVLAIRPVGAPAYDGLVTLQVGSPTDLEKIGAKYAYQLAVNKTLRGQVIAPVLATFEYDTASGRRTAFFL